MVRRSGRRSVAPHYREGRTVRGYSRTSTFNNQNLVVDSSQKGTHAIIRDGKLNGRRAGGVPPNDRTYNIIDKKTGFKYGRTKKLPSSNMPKRYNIFTKKGNKIRQRSIPVRRI